MNRIECEGIAEVAIVGFLTRSFFNEEVEYDSASFQALVDLGLVAAKKFLIGYLETGVYLQSLELFEKSRQLDAERLGKLTPSEAFDNISANAHVALMGLYTTKAFPRFDYSSGRTALMIPKNPANGSQLLYRFISRSDASKGFHATPLVAYWLKRPFQESYPSSWATAFWILPEVRRPWMTCVTDTGRTPTLTAMSLWVTPWHFI